ncbi:MAG TPA: CheR family methyltransferase [Polyangiaceae bacterium]|jgi:chemotaxis protein methyltransferase CheR
MATVLSPALYAILGALVEERTGLHYGEREIELFSSKVMATAFDRGFDSALDYYYALRYDDPDHRALDTLCEALVVNETYFFREADQLATLCDAMLAPLVAAGKRPRVWCAAAASGEEPLTLEMLLHERGFARQVEVVASDISAKALARAAEGVYSQRSLRAIPAEAAARWFHREGDRFAVRRELVESITWRRVNLVDTAAIAELGAFDAVLCRNVLIYFAEQTIREVVETLAIALRPGGHLLVGASESLMRFGTLLVCEEREGSFFYVKATA